MLETKIKDLKNQNSQASELMTIKNEIKEYEKVANTLRNKLDDLES